MNLHEIAARCLELDEKATKGPWQMDHMTGWVTHGGHKLDVTDGHYVVRNSRELIVEYRSACPALARGYLELQAKVEKLEAVAEAASKMKAAFAYYSGPHYHQYSDGMHLPEKDCVGCQIDSSLEALEQAK